MQNIAKAQKEIDRLDAEAKSSAADGSVNDASNKGSNVNGSTTDEMTKKMEKTALVDGEAKA